MEGLLVSYANTYADVVGHVVFGVDPLVNANSFQSLSVGFGRIPRIIPSFVFLLETSRFGTAAPASHHIVRGGQVRFGSSIYIIM